MIAPGPPAALSASATLEDERVLVVGLERHPPQRLARRGSAARRSAARQRVVVGEEAAGPLAEGDLHRAGQGGDVDEDVGVELVDGVGHRVGEHQPPLGVGVGDLGGAAAVVGEHVAGAQRRGRRRRSRRRGTSPVTRTGQPTAPSAAITAITTAPPVMSRFIVDHALAAA